MRGSPARDHGAGGGKEAQGPFLFEVERPAGWLGNPPDAPAEVGHCRADGGLGEYPQAERERGGTDLVAPLQLQRGRDGPQVPVTELPVARPAMLCPATAGQSIADGRKQAEILAIAEHARRHPEAPGRF